MSYASPDEDVARLAYSLWETEGRPHGQDKAHWEQAERELAGAVAPAAVEADTAAAPAKPATRRAKPKPKAEGEADAPAKPKRAPRRTTAAAKA